MRNHKIIALALAGMSMTARAESSALVQSAQAVQESVHSHYAESVLGPVLPRARRLELATYSMFMGPSMNNLDGHLASGAGNSPFVRNGVSFRHLVSLSYLFSDRVKLTPVLDTSQQFDGSSTSGTFVINDPQLRLEISPLGHFDLGGNELRTTLWISAQAPLSQASQSMGSQGALTFSLIPHLHFRGTHFGAMGIFSLKNGAYEKPDGSGSMYSGAFFSGLQGFYRVSDPLLFYLMGFTFVMTGQRPPITDLSSLPPALAAFLNSKMTQIPIGISPGAMIRVYRGISICPRVNWFVNQPIETSTLGVNANIQVI